MNLKQLGERIRTRRENRQLRQADIASALHISAQAVSKWERGENAPDIGTLAPLATLLGVSVEWLLGAKAPTSDTFPATVFCTSVNGYAEKSASLHPRDVAAWINGVYFTLTEIVRRFDGVPIKYVGDGFLGFFAGVNHADRALSAALSVKRMSDTPGIVITLNYGDIFLGTIGHPDYARPDIIADTVNVAFLAMPWVAKHCASGIGLTAAVSEHLESGRAVQEREQITVPGVSASVAMYEPVV